MAASQIHFRSISLPSRLHPINSTEFEAEVEKLKSSQTSSLSKAGSLTSEIIQSGLVGLAELYNSIDELTQSSKEASSIQEALEGSVELLDSCSTIRELVQMMKENVQALQSALRRKGLDCSIQNDVASYICSRKKMSKCIKKSLKTLKNYEGKMSASNNTLNPALREVYGLTVAIFKSALMFFSSSSVAVKSDGWNVVARLMLNKSAGDQSVVSEVGCVDLDVSSVRNGDCKSVDKQMVQKRLQNLESCIEGLEMGLEIVFRQLLQTRVNLLNIVTNH